MVDCSMTPDPDGVCRKLAKDAFAFLEDELGYSASDLPDGAVEYASARMRVVIAFYKGQVNVDLGSISDGHLHNAYAVINALTPELAMSPPAPEAFDETSVRNELSRLASVLRVRCRAYVQGDLSHVDSIEAYESEQGEAFKKLMIERMNRASERRGR